jgi:integrase
MTHRPNRVFELVRSIFRWAVGRDLLQVDPTWGMPPPINTETPRDRELSPAEIRQLWLALDRAPVAKRATKGIARGERATVTGDLPLTRATALTLKLALATGQRIGEVSGIAISELDLNDVAPVWTIPAGRSKNRQANRVPLSPLAIRLIEEARQLASDSDWLFPGVQGARPIDPHAPTKALERARAAIGLDDFRIHDLRRTAATRMAEMGIAPHTISLILNHVSARQGTVTGKVYVQYSYDREKREALGKWGERLETIIAGLAEANVIPLRC